MSEEFYDNDFSASHDDKRIKIGVVVVHGIGRQQRFEHLKMVVNNIVKVFRADNTLQVEVIEHPENHTSDFKSVIFVQDLSGQITEFHFHEVWWADIGAKASLQDTLAFWAWASSLWTKSRHLRGSLADAYQETMIYPGTRNSSEVERIGRKISWWARIRLFFTSFVFVSVVPLTTTINRVILPIFRTQISLDFIPQFMGKVKLFTQEDLDSECPLEDSEYPPRIAIRRRMIQTMVSVSTEQYDKWYLLAHSLGSVIAFNSLMESEKQLSNYIDWDLWKEVKKNGFHNNEKGEEDLEVLGKTRPKRPFWLNESDSVSRRKLFGNLRGFITYGSPLSKFAVLWPGVTYMNKDEKVFNQDFEWINIYDPTDPIAGPVSSEFSPFSSASDEDLWKSPIPADILHKPSLSGFLSRFHLLSHLSYLKYFSNRQKLVNETEEPLIKSISYWLLKGNKFTIESSNINENKWILIRETTWIVTSITIFVLIAYLMPVFFNQTTSFLEWIIFNLLYRLNGNIVLPAFIPDGTSIFYNIVPFLVASFSIFMFLAFAWVIFSGAVRWLIEVFRRSTFNFRSAEREIRFHFAQNPDQPFGYVSLVDKFGYFYSRKVIEMVLEKLKTNKIVVEINLNNEPAYYFQRKLSDDF